MSTDVDVVLLKIWKVCIGEALKLPCQAANATSSSGLTRGWRKRRFRRWRQAHCRACLFS